MSARLNVCFNGCSLTAGEGFPADQRIDFIYDRLISKKFNFKNTNVAEAGSSNYRIFMRSAKAIISQQYDIVFTQWSGLNRLWLSPGPDSVFYTNDRQDSDFHYRDIYLSKNEKQKFKDTVLMLNHDWQNIIDLIEYCKILEQLTEHTSTRVIFINGLVPWKNDLVTPMGDDLSTSFSDYTKSILDFDHRDDTEIIKFFQRLQTRFAEINRDLWVNLFDPFIENAIDIGPEGHHPGVQSHQWMAEQIINYITEREIA